MKHICIGLAVFAGAMLAVSCAPGTAPLYVDYDVEDAEGEILERIERALIAADWQIRPAPVSNVVATDTLIVGKWVFYSLEVSLEVAPIGLDHVRVLVHPYRKYAGGARRKVRFFKGNLQAAILPKLHKAFADEGLVPVGARG